MTFDRRNEGGPGVARKVVSLPPRAHIETWAGANEAKDEKLRTRSLERKARDAGFKLRHSDRGWALMDAGGKLVGERNDLTLKQVESLLTAALKK